MNEGRARTADAHAIQRATASDTEPAPPRQGTGLAVPASPGSARLEVLAFAPPTVQPAVGGPARGEATAANTPPAQAAASIVQPGVAAAIQAATVAPILAPILAAAPGAFGASAASGPGIDAGGPGGAGAGSAVAAAGVGAPLPLFNPFLARRPPRDARRQAGLPERIRGLWVILRVLGWRRRRPALSEPGPPEDEEAAALRAWRAALDRRKA